LATYRPLTLACGLWPPRPTNSLQMPICKELKFANKAAIQVPNGYFPSNRYSRCRSHRAPSRAHCVASLRPIAGLTSHDEQMLVQSFSCIGHSFLRRHSLAKLGDLALQLQEGGENLLLLSLLELPPI